MDVKELEEKVQVEYLKLNIEDGRIQESSVPYMAPELFNLPSNQIKALINVIAPMLKETKP